MSTSNGHPPPLDLRSLTYRAGDRVLVRRFNPPPTPAERLSRRICPGGHGNPTRNGTCPRCGAPA